MNDDDKQTKPTTVTVSIELPAPPDGCGCPKLTSVEIEDVGRMFYSPYEKWEEVQFAHVGLRLIVCSRIHKFPANSVGTFYPCSNKWWFTDGAIRRVTDLSWESSEGRFMSANLFSDFTPPPERHPYTVKNGVVVKDGEK